MFPNPQNRVRSEKREQSFLQTDLVSQSGFQPPVVQETWTTNVVTLSDTKNGVLNPRWRQQIKDGGQAGTAYSRTLQDANCTGGGGAVFHNGTYTIPGTSQLKENSTRVSGGTILVAPSAHIDLADVTLRARNKALARLYSAIRSEQQHLNSLISIGELGETVRMLRKPFRAFQDHVTKYFDSLEVKLRRRKRGNKVRYIRKRSRKVEFWPSDSDPGEIKKILSESWLEFSFGVRPVVSDTVALAEMIARLCESTRRGAVKGFAAETSSGMPSVGSGSYGMLRYRQTSVAMTEAVSIFRAGLNTAVNWPDGSIGRLRELAGWTPENFVPTLYNLCPWSFLLDYVTNVGQVVSSDWTSTASVVWAIESQKVTTKQTVYRPLDHDSMRKDASYKYATGTDLGRSEGIYLTNTRLILDVANMPTPMYQTKRIGELNPMQVTNFVALIGARKRTLSRLLTSHRGS